MSRPSDVESPTKQVWERYKHLDELLSDSSWLGATISDGILCEVWRAVKAEHGEVAEASGDVAKRELAGKDLICYCAPKACHGDVLIEVANAELRREP